MTDEQLNLKPVKTTDFAMLCSITVRDCLEIRLQFTEAIEIDCLKRQKKKITALQCSLNYLSQKA